MTTAACRESVSPWRHVRAIALLPFMNTVVIPSALLAWFPRTQWPGRDTAAVVATLVGLVLITAGATLVVHCIRLFVRFGSGTLAPWDQTRELVSSGAYRHSRNPMKAGLFLVLAGEVLLTQSVAVTAWFACFALVNVLYIRLHEEPGLVARFGARYHAYCARVPRWWPALRNFHRSEVQ